MLDATHDAALRSWVESANDAGQRLPDPEPAVRALPASRQRRAAARRRRDRRPGARPARGSPSAGRPKASFPNCCGRSRPATSTPSWRSGRSRARGAAGAAVAGAAPRQRAAAAARALPRAAGRGRDGAAVPRSATTPISTPASTTRPRSASCSAPTRRCCRTTSGCRSAITAARRRSSSAARRFVRPAGPDQGRGATRRSSGRAAGSTTSSSSALLIGPGNALGEPVAMAEAEDQLFGLVLLNDWSARDVQAWEYQPLGPFLAKNFAIDDLAVDRHDGGAGAVSRPVRTPGSRPAAAAVSRQRGEPRARRDRRSRSRSGCRRRRCRRKGRPAVRLMQSNFRDAYWTLAQLVAHHTSNGCNLQSGDLLGTGTQSGPGAGQGGSMLELTAGGKQPLQLPDGEDAHLPRRRRHGDPARLVRARRLCAHRLRRLRRDGACRLIELTLCERTVTTLPDRTGGALRSEVKEEASAGGRCRGT